MDRETVITHLQIIHTWASFARERDLQFFTPKHLEDIAQWSDDALALLKQEAVIRCKDCIHADISASGLIKCQGFFRTPDWFCADGERRLNND